MTFTAAAGGFAIARVTADNYQINAEEVEYEFELQAQDNFLNPAILKMILPKQISVREDAQITDTEGAMQFVQGSSRIEILFNRIIYIYNAFP